MTKRIRNILGVLVLMLLIALFFCAGKIHSINMNVAAPAQNFNTIIHSYIINTDGNFPASEADLERKGFLKKTVITDGIVYLYRGISENKENWNTFRNFNLFEIAYGASLEHIKMIDGKLYDKSTNEQILLIDGPYKLGLKKSVYEPITLHWYNLMLQERQQVKVPQEPNSNTE